MDPPPKKIVQMPRSSMKEDGSEITLFLEDDEGNTHELVYAPDTLKSQIRTILALLGHAYTQETAAAGQAMTRAIEATGFGVASVAGEDKLILTFESDKSLEHHFAIPTETAPELRKRLLLAEKLNKKQNKPLRH